MKLIELIGKLLRSNIPSWIISCYFEPHRHYHNIDHILDLCTKAESCDILTDKLFKAIIFHDIVYDPKSNTNEEDSVRYMNSIGIFDKDVEKAILSTKSHNETTDHELSRQLCELDLSILKSDFETLKDFEHKIYKEYDFVPFELYKNVRLAILERLGASDEHISYLKNFNTAIND